MSKKAEQANSKEARQILQRHIDHVKWSLCAFSTEQLRGQRWMLSASPKSGCPPVLKKALTVTEQAQALHFRLTIHCFTEAGRRLRASSRPRVRWGAQAFDSNCDFACMYSAILDEARLLSSWTMEKEKALLKAFYQRLLGIVPIFSRILYILFEWSVCIYRLNGRFVFFWNCLAFQKTMHCFRDYMAEIEAAVTAKLATWKLQHLGVWCDLVEPPATPVKVSTASELMELEDEAHSARFREVRAKLAQDVSSMCQYNSEKEEVTRRSHVVKVMHEKSQLEIGKELLVQCLVFLSIALVCFYLDRFLFFSVAWKNIFVNIYIY